MEEGGAGEGDGKGEIRPRKMRRRISERVPRRSERGRPWRRRQRRRTKRKAGTVHIISRETASTFRDRHIPAIKCVAFSAVIALHAVGSMILQRRRFAIIQLGLLATNANAASNHPNAVFVTTRNSGRGRRSRIAADFARAFSLSSSSSSSSSSPHSPRKRCDDNRDDNYDVNDDRWDNYRHRGRKGRMAPRVGDVGVDNGNLERPSRRDALYTLLSSSLSSSVVVASSASSPSPCHAADEENVEPAECRNGRVLSGR
jgi:hypothetical protein